MIDYKKISEQLMVRYAEQVKERIEGAKQLINIYEREQVAYNDGVVAAIAAVKQAMEKQ